MIRAWRPTPRPRCGANPMCWLNNIQSLIMNIGLGGDGIVAGFMCPPADGPGDITAVVMLITTLYAPLEHLGFAYREIKQTTIDMEKMFGLLDEQPDVADAPGAVALKAVARRSRVRACLVQHEGRDKGLRRRLVHRARG